MIRPLKTVLYFVLPLEQAKEAVANTDRPLLLTGTERFQRAFMSLDDACNAREQDRSARQDGSPPSAIVKAEFESPQLLHHILQAHGTPVMAMRCPVYRRMVWHVPYTAFDFLNANLNRQLVGTYPE